MWEGHVIRVPILRSLFLQSAELTLKYGNRCVQNMLEPWWNMHGGAQWATIGTLLVVNNLITPIQPHYWLCFLRLWRYGVSELCSYNIFNQINSYWLWLQSGIWTFTLICCVYELNYLVSVSFSPLDEARRWFKNIVQM